MTTIIDTDVLLGLFLPYDVHHENATAILGKLRQLHCTILISPTTLGEFALLASSRIGRQQTQAAVGLLTSNQFRTLAITPQIAHEAAALYQKQTSKEESLFDCFLMILATQSHVDCICAFDRGYTKKGFTLVGDFLASKAQ